MRAAGTAVEDLSLAMRQALGQRKPVVLNMPVDVQTAVAISQMATPHEEPEPAEPDPDALDRALGLLAVARRPVVIAGRGAIESDTRDQILRLSDVLNAPVATTLMARGIFTGHSFNLGIFGTLSSPPAIETIHKSDCVVAFGASLNRYTTSYGGLTAEKSVIQVDHDPAVLRSWSTRYVGIRGDARLTAARMTDALRRLGDPPPGLRSEKMSHTLQKHDPSSEFTDASSRDGLDPRTLMIRLNEIVPEDRSVVTDVGGFLRTALRYLDAPDPRATVVPGNFGAIGLGMGHAVGAGVARPDRPVLAVVGDGGFMMSGIGEFETAVRYGIDVITVVMNNSGYEIERNVLRDWGCEPALATMQRPDFAQVARSIGGEGASIRNFSDLQEIERAIGDRKSALLIDAHLATI